MICPKCKCEYEEGYTKCNDCGIDLVHFQEPLVPEKHISSKGISLIKFAVNLLFLLAFQFIFVIVAYEFYFVFRMSTVGVSGNALEQVSAYIWALMVFELFIAVTIIIWGLSKKEIQ